jgi:glycosyltransferase involved in cell wall biosynthesis
MKATLGSVLAQRAVDLEVVVVDDGSSDATPAALRAVNDARLRWHRNEQPTGVSNARNAGLAKVDTPWVAFTDDDDLWAPDKLAQQLASFQAHPEAKWSIASSVVVDKKLRIVRHEEAPAAATLVEEVLKNNCVPGGGSGVLASTDLVREVGGFDPQFSNLADWDLWIRLALAAPATSVPRPLVAYRVHPGGMAHRVRRTEDEFEVITAKYANDRSRRGISLDRGTWHRYLGQLHLRNGDQRAAAHSYLLAARAGHPTRYGVVALCLLVPGLWTWAERRGRLRVPPQWSTEAGAWLDHLRTDQSSGSRHSQ